MESRRSYYILLTLLIFLFAALVICICGLLYVYGTAANQTCDKKLCTSEDCLRSATMFVESMNKSVDPCENFYQFACGNYPKHHPIPSTAASRDRYDDVLDTIVIPIMRNYMEQIDSSTDPDAVIKSRILYRSCMAEDKMDEAGPEILLKLLDQIGLPYLGFTSKQFFEERNSSLSTILAGVKKYIYIDYLFGTTVCTDLKNGTVNQICLFKPDGTINGIYSFNKITEKMRNMNNRKIRETLASEEKVEDDITAEDTHLNYKKRIHISFINSTWTEISKFQTNISKPNNIELERQALQIFSFDENLSKLRSEVFDLDGELPIVMTLNELQTFTDNIMRSSPRQFERIIDWEEYFVTLFKDVKNVKLDFKTDFIQIYDIQYFKELFKYLFGVRKKQLEENLSNDVIVSNVWWEVVRKVMPYTTNQLRFIHDNHFYKISYPVIKRSRSNYCAYVVNKMMGMAVSRMLINMESLTYNKNMMFEIIKNIKWAFERIVHDLKWMDETTKARTVDKANQIKVLVGYPEFIEDEKELNDYYNNFEVFENNFFGNIIRFRQHDLNATLVKLREFNDHTIDKWVFDSFEVNANFKSKARTIIIPAGILQFPFFGHDLQVLNYGFLSEIFGHELTHGFDNNGLNFDQNGNENMWWTNQTIDEYKNRSDCFVRHYESYTLPEIDVKINGQLTLDENIADNGGIREAFLGYRKFVTDHGEEPRLPGLEEYTNEQLYYLALANTWCEATTLASIKLSVSDSHSPKSIRVNAALTNSEEFSEVWKCKKGKNMNPVDEKCKIW